MYLTPTVLGSRTWYVPLQRTTYNVLDVGLDDYVTSDQMVGGTQDWYLHEDLVRGAVRGTSSGICTNSYLRWEGWTVCSWSGMWNVEWGERTTSPDADLRRLRTQNFLVPKLCSDNDCSMMESEKIDKTTRF